MLAGLISSVLARLVLSVLARVFRRRGPDDMTTRTGRSVGWKVPASGSCLMTTPNGTVWCTSWRTSARNPCCASSVTACSMGRPSTKGIRAVSGPSPAVSSYTNSAASTTTASTATPRVRLTTGATHPEGCANAFMQLVGTRARVRRAGRVDARRSRLSSARTAGRANGSGGRSPSARWGRRWLCAPG